MLNPYLFHIHSTLARFSYNGTLFTIEMRHTIEIKRSKSRKMK